MSTSQNHPEIPPDQQPDPSHLERQIQFQRALERNLRSYIEYAQEQKKLHYIHITIFTVSLYQFAEVVVVGISMWMTYNNTTLFSFFIVSAATDLLSMIPSFYYSYLIHQNEIQFLVGLLWFQYDIEQKPQFGMQEILSQSNCICKYDAILSLSLQTILLGLVLFVQVRTEDERILIQYGSFDGRVDYSNDGDYQSTIDPICNIHNLNQALLSKRIPQNLQLNHQFIRI